MSHHTFIFTRYNLLQPATGTIYDFQNGRIMLWQDHEGFQPPAETAIAAVYPSTARGYMTEYLKTILLQMEVPSVSGMVQKRFPMHFGGTGSSAREGAAVLIFPATGS